MKTRFRLVAALLLAGSATAAFAAGPAPVCPIRPGTLCVEFDLEGARLAGADLAIADFSRSNLKGADLSGANLRNADMDGALLVGANLSQAVLVSADLGGADLRNAKARTCAAHA